MLVLTAAIAVTAVVHFVLQAAGGRDLLAVHVVWLLPVTFAMVVMVSTVGVFVAKYGKNRNQNWRRRRVFALSAVLIGLGIAAYWFPSDADICRVGYSVDVQLCVAQTLWAGVTILAAIFAAMLVAYTPTASLWLGLVLTVALALLAGNYSNIQDEYMTLQPDIFVTALLVIWRMWVILAPAMLGAAVAARMRAGRAA